MRIRQSFVANSSSSSFIVAVNKKDDSYDPKSFLVNIPSISYKAIDISDYIQKELYDNEYIVKASSYKDCKRYFAHEINMILQCSHQLISPFDLSNAQENMKKNLEKEIGNLINKRLYDVIVKRNLKYLKNIRKLAHSKISKYYKMAFSSIESAIKEDRLSLINMMDIMYSFIQELQNDGSRYNFLYQQQMVLLGKPFYYNLYDFIKLINNTDNNNFINETVLTDDIFKNFIKHLQPLRPYMNFNLIGGMYARNSMYDNGYIFSNEFQLILCKYFQIFLKMVYLVLKENKIIMSLVVGNGGGGENLHTYDYDVYCALCDNMIPTIDVIDITM